MSKKKKPGPRGGSREPGAARPARPARAPSAASPAPKAWLDPWAWICALAPVALVLKSLGAPLCEPVAEDIDFLHRAFLEPGGRTLLDGGGSQAFWRPIPHQLYYQLLGRTILSHPERVAALHAVLLGVSTLLLFRAFRRAWPAPWAALIATFPLLSESTRTLIAWPTHFVDLGLWLFTAIALHETAARRLWTALAALLCALLCKEVAVAAALLLPWLPGAGPRGLRERLRWAAAMAAAVALWAAAYLSIRHRYGLALPHNLETSDAEISVITRMAWAVENSLRALFSLPAVPVRGEWALSAALTALVVLALGALLASRKARHRLAAGFALPLWGLGWFLAASATLTVIYPMWMPNRSGFGSLGFGALCAGLIGAAGPGLLAAFAALRLVAFALAPGPPALITPIAPETGAFMDFQHLVRLQRLMRNTRAALAARYPRMPHDAIVGQHYLPRHAEYAFGGDKALQVWYADTTLRWMKYADFETRPDTPVLVIVQYQTSGTPQIALVEPEAMRCFLKALDHLQHGRWEEGLKWCARADSIPNDPAARVFRGTVAGQRSIALLALGHGDEAEREARRGLTLWPENTASLYALGNIEFERGNLVAAKVDADSVLNFIPDHDGALRLLQLIREAEKGR